MTFEDLKNKNGVVVDRRNVQRMRAGFLFPYSFYR